MDRAHKWRKAWVPPTGAQPESSYKICRYVKVAKEVKEGEDETNGDDEDEEEGEGEGEGEGEEEEEEEGEDEEEGDGKVTAAATPAVGTPAGAGDEVALGESVAPTSTPAVPTSSDPAPAPETTPPVTIPTSDPPATVEHTAIPSNAIELTNTTPDHVADGSSATVQGGIEITQPHPEPTSAPVQAPTIVGSLGQNEEKMEIDEPVIEKGEIVEEDAGLVMGEMTPPVGQKELEITERDQVKEAEAVADVPLVQEESVEETKETSAAEQPIAETKLE